MMPYQNFPLFRFQVCKEGFEVTEELIKHLKTHLVDTPFRCGLCTYATVSRTQLDSHMQLTHKTKLMVSIYYIKDKVEPR